jgi:hypothetical protein
MKRLIVIALIFVTLSSKAQKKVIVELPETYELSNIILALTKYGVSDKWEVQKNTKYYQDVLRYFEPVKNHPLLDSANYSREKWEDYLSFRTDAFAFSFGVDGKLKRDVDFYAVYGHKAFDKNLKLINDFVEKSNFRQFYQQKKEFYKHIVQNYNDYYFVDKSFKYLDDNIGRPNNYNANSKYVVVLSPLVFRMNCHRDIDKNTTADFPSASEEFINGVNEKDINSRVVGNHMIFTEMDHGYVNPISDKYSELISNNFNIKTWDKKSGYLGASCFNEYMTWAVYDLFIKENFPQLSDSIAIQWQYQNAARGFIAQNLFAKKVVELYSKKGSKGFESIYEPLLKWCKSIESNISQPTLLNIDSKNFVKADVNNVELNFSEEMDTKLPIGVQIVEFKNGKQTGKDKVIGIKNFKWTNEGKTLTFKIDAEFEEFALIFNWWGNNKPLVSKNGVFLAPQSYVLLKIQ